MKFLIAFPVLAAGLAGVALAQADSMAAPTAAAATAAPVVAKAVAAAPPQMAPATPVVETSAAAPAEYKPCSKDVQDECSNSSGAHRKMRAHHRRGSTHRHRVAQ